MTTLDLELQALVDALLLEQGAFAPLELLFSSGRLLFADYESWRRREIETLDDVFMGDRDKMRAELERAAGYARRIGLVEEVQEFHSWQVDEPAHIDTSASAGSPLRISADTQLQRLICSRYVSTQKAPQMDLFFDNPVGALTNGLARALSARNRSDAQRLLDRLYAQAPNHPDLAGFDQMLEALGHLGGAISDPGAETEFLLRVTPVARRLLGPQSRDLLAPLWRQLAAALEGVSFSPDGPSLHGSFALSQAQDWVRVGESVLGESGWWRHGVLCRRLLDSALHRHHRVEALTAWCHLCWNAPDQAGEARQRFGHSDLGRSDLAAWWQQFLDVEYDCCEPDGAAGEASRTAEPASVTAEAALAVSDFPAWLLLVQPGLAWQLALDLPKGRTPGEEHYRCIHRWVHARRANRSQEEIDLRKMLRASHPVLFRALKRTV